MKTKTLFVLTAILFLFGCTKTEMHYSSTGHSGARLETGSVISIITSDYYREISDCIEKELKKNIPEAKFISGSEFRKALYPWAEPSTAPKNEKEFANLLNKPLVLERVKNLGIKFIIYVSTSAKIDQSGKLVGIVGIEGGGGVVGYHSEKRETEITATVFDVNKAVAMGEANTHSEGKDGVIGIGIPIPFFSFPTSKACNETAKNISNILLGR
jgi:hypothetical protein